MKSFRLYAMPTKPDTVDRLENQRFSRITPDYSLVYTDGDAPDGSAELKDNDAKRLTRGDENWLLSCNLILIKEEIAKRKPEMLRALGEKLDSLEAMLKELSEEAKREGSDKE